MSLADVYCRFNRARGMEVQELLLLDDKLCSIIDNANVAVGVPR